MQNNLSNKIIDSTSKWKNYTLDLVAVPTTDTGALAEKAKTWRVKPIKGIRQISPVTSVEGMSIFVYFESCMH